MRKMRTNRMRTFVTALAVAAVAAGVPAVTAHAEELATDTDAVTAGVEDTQADLPGEEVSTDEVTVEAKDTPYYNISINGGTFDGTYYRLGGQVIASAFFCDGTYTYYLQADGAAMKDKLTYHPDGEHVIYFDSQGHEVFSNFAEVKQSISGEAVNDMCFFDVYGYMYVNKLTYNQEGTKLYYVNEYGVIERNGWFKFPDFIEGLTTGVNESMSSDSIYDLYGYGNSDGTLMTNTWTYNWDGQAVYLQGNGSTAKGLHNIGGEWCLFDANDGHLIQKTATHPGTYTLTKYNDGAYTVTTRNVFGVITSYTYLENPRGGLAAGDICAYSENTYYDSGQVRTRKTGREFGSNSLINCEYLYYESGDLQWYREYFTSDGVMTSGHEYYFSDDKPTNWEDMLGDESANTKTGGRYYEYYYDKETGVVGGLMYNEEIVYYPPYGNLGQQTYMEKITEYDINGNITDSYTRTYDMNYNLISEEHK